VRPTKLTVGKGITIRASEQEEWIKEYYEIEIALTDPSEMEVTRANALGMIDAWLSEAARAEKVKAALLELDPAQLEELPWTNYGTRERCKPGDAGWIKNPEFFRDVKDEPARSRAIALAKAIRAGGRKLRLGEYEFSLSGENDRFIGRRPVKRGKAGDIHVLERMDRNLKNIKKAGEALTGPP